MKRTTLIIIMILNIVNTLNAQDIKIGAKAGVNLASVTGDGIEKASMRPSFHFGGMAEIPISAELYLQPELLFSSQGYKVKANNATGILNYLNLPVIAKYYITDKFSIEAGPQLGYLLSANVKVDEKPNINNPSTPMPDTTPGKVFKTKSSTEKATSVEQKEDTKEFFKSIDLSFGFGAGYKLDNGINLSARYNFGLSNIAEDAENIKNNIIMLSVGYFFW